MKGKEFENLDQIEHFIKENAPDWKVNRGKETIYNYVEHADDYEVLQIFKPSEDKPFAEFWKGYYASFPEEYNAQYGLNITPNRAYFSVIGNLNDIMQKIIKEF